MLRRNGQRTADSAVGHLPVPVAYPSGVTTAGLPSSSYFQLRIVALFHRSSVASEGCPLVNEYSTSVDAEYICARGANCRGLERVLAPQGRVDARLFRVWQKLANLSKKLPRAEWLRHVAVATRRASLGVVSAQGIRRDRNDRY